MSTREIWTTVAKRGQVTLPADVRRLLGVGAGDKVAFVVSEGRVHVVRPRSVVERTAGIFKGAGPPLTAEEERAAAEQAIADDVMERAGG